MKISKQARRDGRDLFKACLVDGILDEGRVRDAVAQVLKRKPRGYLAIVVHFKRLVKLHLDRRTARVENATETTPEQQESIRSNLERQYGAGLQLTYWINPSLIGGLRVRIGSDIYDGSVAGRLAALQSGSEF